MSLKKKHLNGNILSNWDGGILRRFTIFINKI